MSFLERLILSEARGPLGARARLAAWHALRALRLIWYFFPRSQRRLAFWAGTWAWVSAGAWLSVAGSAVASRLGGFLVAGSLMPAIFWLFSFEIRPSVRYRGFVGARLVVLAAVLATLRHLFTSPALFHELMSAPLDMIVLNWFFFSLIVSLFGFLMLLLLEWIGPPFCRKLFSIASALRDQSAWSHAFHRWRQSMRDRLARSRAQLHPIDEQSRESLDRLRLQSSARSGKSSSSRRL